MTLAAMSPSTSWLFLGLCLWVVVNAALLARQVRRERSRRRPPRHVPDTTPEGRHGGAA